MKVLVVHNDYQSTLIGGEDVVVAREIAGLKAVLGDKQVFQYRVSNDGINPMKLAFTLWGNQQHYDNVKALVKQHQINIVHVHNFFPLLTPLVFMAAKEADARVIHTLHNFRWWCVAGTLFREGTACEKCVHQKLGIAGIKYGCYRGSRVQSLAASLAFYWYRIKQYQRYIDAYFALTPFLQEKLANFGLNKNVYLKPNPIEVPHITPHLNKQDYLFVGRLEAAKGIELLLKTWEELPQDYCLKIIGDGEQRVHLERQYARNNIRFLGQLPHQEVVRHYQQAQYLVHPSMAYETFGLTLVEALAVGTPVIGLDIGPRRYFIQHEHNGFLSDVGQFKQTILASKYRTDYAMLSQNAAESVKRFYLPQVIEQQISLYQQVTSKV